MGACALMSLPNIKERNMPRAKAKGDKTKYLEIARSEDRQNENNDCTVISFAAVTGQPYKTAHTLLAKRGRKQGRGLRMTLVEDALNEVGFKAERTNVRDFIDRYPSPHHRLFSVTSHHPDRFNRVWADGNNYLFVTPQHVLAVVNGENIDWSRGQALRVSYIWRIVKMTDAEHAAALARINK